MTTNGLKIRTERDALAAENAELREVLKSMKAAGEKLVSAYLDQMVFIQSARQDDGFTALRAALVKANGVPIEETTSAMSDESTRTDADEAAEEAAASAPKGSKGFIYINPIIIGCAVFIAALSFIVNVFGDKT